MILDGEETFQMEQILKCLREPLPYKLPSEYTWDAEAQGWWFLATAHAQAELIKRVETLIEELEVS